MKRHVLPLAFALTAFGCSQPAENNGTTNNGTCTSGKCDDSNGRDLAKELDGRNDVIATFIRGAANNDGTIEGDYSTFLDGVGEVLGCDESTEKTFIILMSKNGFFPRNISTRCSADAVKASEFYLSTQSDYGDRSDINPRDFKMIAWDADADKYNTYEVKDDGTGEGPLYIDVEPDHCLACHTNPPSMTGNEIPFTPIMNELTNPWTLWNAEPDFDSHKFDELISAEVASGEVYTTMTAGAKLGPASDFETMIRASIDRVANSRLKARRDPADVEKALALLRPMFCDETVNYASENHDSGEVSTAIIIDDAIRHLYLSIRPDNWPYDWLNDGRMRLASVDGGIPPIEVMPVRGEATLQVEVGLVARRALTAQQVLQVRALDWKRPVFSEFRCNLYEEGAERVRANPPDLAELERVSSLLGPLFEEIMKYEATDPDSGETVQWSLLSADGSLISIPDVEEPDAQEALLYGVFDAYTRDLDGFATELETWFDAVQQASTREELEAERQRRGCVTKRGYPSAPDVPGISCTP